MSLRLTTIAMLLGTAVSTLGQMPTKFTRVYGNSDRDLPTPVHSSKTASEVAALQGVLSFVKATGVTGFLGFTAHGNVTFAGDTVSYPATLYVLGSEKYRLDVQKSSGTESTIYNGPLAEFISAAAARSSIPSDISVVGLLAFPRLLSAEYPHKTSLITDDGLVSIAGTKLHRITLEDPSLDGIGSPWKISDLYFDPISGLLVQSASFAHLSTSDAALYMFSTTYEDYRHLGRVSLPYRFTQSLNGNLEWTLQLTEADLQSIPNSSLFTF